MGMGVCVAREIPFFTLQLNVSTESQALLGETVRKENMAKLCL